MTCKIVPDMTYNVFGGTLNLAQSVSECRSQHTPYNMAATDGVEFSDVTAPCVQIFVIVFVIVHYRLCYLGA